MNEFAIFKRFNDPDQANELAETLKKSGIEFQLVDNSPSVDLTFTGNNTLQSETQVMIKQSDFDTANKILKDQAEEIMTNLNKDYYLFEFSNDELYEILAKPDEWNSFDYTFAQKILKDRGHHISEAKLNLLKNERITALSIPEKSHSAWIFAGYVSSLLGGIFGMFLGWYLWHMKKTLPNGEKIYMCSESDRMHGKWMFLIGVVIFPFALLVWLLNLLNF